MSYKKSCLLFLGEKTSTGSSEDGSVMSHFHPVFLFLACWNPYRLSCNLIILLSKLSWTQL